MKKQRICASNPGLSATGQDEPDDKRRLASLKSIRTATGVSVDRWDTLLEGLPVLSIERIAANAHKIDPHPAWLNIWRSANAAWLKTEDEEQGEQADLLCELLVTTPATSPEGLYAQFTWLQEDLGKEYIDIMFSEWHRDCMDTLAQGLSALAGEIST